MNTFAKMMNGKHNSLKTKYKPDYEPTAQSGIHPMLVNHVILRRVNRSTLSLSLH